MDPSVLAGLMAQLGISGVDPTKLSAAMTLVEMLGGQVSVDQEALQAYYPKVDEKSLYMPTNVPKNFYYDAEGLRNAGRIGNMRSLTSVNSNVFRKLLGIE